MELHYGLASPRGLRFDASNVWRRSVDAEFHARPVRAMSAEDRAVYLCLHGLKHGFTRLVWIDDVARAVRAVPHEKLFRFTQKQNLGLPVAIGCEVVRATLGLPLKITSELERDPRLTETAQHAARLLLAGAVPEINGPEVWSFLPANGDGSEAALATAAQLFHADGPRPQMG